MGLLARPLRARPGGRPVERVPYESADGPLGPLWQQRFGDVSSEPCRGVRETRIPPAKRSNALNRHEEVLAETTMRRLRHRAGRLDPLVDSCADWEPPATGAYLIVCSPDQLRRYIQSGLEDHGRAGLHIDAANAKRPAVGRPTVPAVRRDPLLRRLDDWRIASLVRARANVYASCQAGRGLIEVRFPRVLITPSRPLTHRRS